ncbi:unnamed protein product, partial [Cuscuta epithymum]
MAIQILGILQTFPTIFVIWTAFARTCISHPLDALSPEEINQTSVIVLGLHPSATFHYVDLEEPEKNDVIDLLSSSSQPKSLPYRKARAVVRANNETREIVVDLIAGSIVSNEVHGGHGFPPFTADEVVSASRLTLTYPQFQESITQRGLNISQVTCIP